MPTRLALRMLPYVLPTFFMNGARKKVIIAQRRAAAEIKQWDRDQVLNYQDQLRRARGQSPKNRKTENDRVFEDADTVINPDDQAKHLKSAKLSTSRTVTLMLILASIKDTPKSDSVVGTWETTFSDWMRIESRQ